MTPYPQDHVISTSRWRAGATGAHTAAESRREPVSSYHRGIGALANASAVPWCRRARRARQNEPPYQAFCVSALSTPPMTTRLVVLATCLRVTTDASPLRFSAPPLAPLSRRNPAPSPTESPLRAPRSGQRHTKRGMGGSGMINAVDSPEPAVCNRAHIDGDVNAPKQITPPRH